MASAASASKHAERQQACRVQQSWRSTGGPPVVPWWLARWSAIDCVYGASPHHDPPPTFRMPQATCDLLPATRHIPLRSPLPLPLLLLPLPLPLPLPLLTTLNPCPPLTRYRPCERCVKYGLTDCVDSTRKPRKTGVKR
jgi:hypothetical protein